MTRKTWVLVIASILVSSTLLEVHVFAAGERKKIVMVSNSAAFVLLQEVLQNPLNGINVVHTLPMIYALAIELSPNQTDAELLNLLLGISGAQVYDDLRVSVLPITKSPDGVVFLTQDMYAWGLMRIGADVAHQKMPDWTGKGVQVAIVDTGVGDTAIVGCTHPDLPLIVVGFNALPGGGSYCDRHGHGTHMAGIIAARANKRGLIGVAPEAGIVAVKVLDDNGKGFLSNVLYGLQWIYDNQSQKQLWLVNMSLGFSADSPALLQATQRLSDSGTLIVASTGNRCSDDPGQDEGAGADGEGPTCDTPQTTDIKYPANYPWVLAVAATDDANKITDYSLVGAEVDIVAPGGIYKGKRILSTSIDAWYAYGDGTSQAAAHVTGTLALKLQQNSHLSLDQIRTLLKHTATQLGYPPKQQGRGLIAVEPLLAAPE